MVLSFIHFRKDFHKVEYFHEVERAGGWFKYDETQIMK